MRTFYSEFELGLALRTDKLILTVNSRVQLYEDAVVCYYKTADVS